ncbi:MAG: hypothetical protein ABJF23_33770 [Bryobacteraceae bacterium]
MGLRKKPEERPARAVVNEREVEQLIEKGGSVATQERRRAKTSNFPLRFMTGDMVDRIEQSRKKRTVAPSINAWINEAILDKLKTEQ